MRAFNKRTLDFEKFKEYIMHKNELNDKLAPFYNKYRVQKAEARELQ